MIRAACSKSSRGSRSGNHAPSAGSPMLITTIDRQVESAKNSPSTPGRVEARHRPRRQPDGTDGEHEVPRLQSRVEPRVALAQLRLAGVALTRLRTGGEQLRDELVEVQVHRQHRRRGRGRRLVPVAVGHVREQPRPRLRRLHEQDPQRVGVRLRRRVVEQLVDVAQLLVGDRRVGELVRAARLA